MRTAITLRDRRQKQTAWKDKHTTQHNSPKRQELPWVSRLFRHSARKQGRLILPMQNTIWGYHENYNNKKITDLFHYKQ